MNPLEIDHSFKRRGPPWIYPEAGLDFPQGSSLATRPRSEELLQQVLVGSPAPQKHLDAAWQDRGEGPKLPAFDAPETGGAEQNLYLSAF